MQKKLLSGFLIAASLLISSCGGGSDDPTPTPTDTTETSSVVYNQGPYFIAVKASDGTEYAIQVNSLESGNIDIAKNFIELPQKEYTWVFSGNTAVGMSYQQQYAGIGYGMRLDSENSAIRTLGEFIIEARFSNYGFFNNQLVTSVAGQVSADGTRNDGATFTFWNITGDKVTLARTKTIWTEDITGNGQQVTFSGLVDNGDGTFLSAMIQSAYNQVGTGVGSSVGEVLYPDSVWVAKLDSNLNVLHVYRDNRISYAAGQYRAQVLRSLLKADDGTVYAFSNAFVSNTTLKAGALRIKSGATTFDPDYYFDLQTPADGFKFRRVWHMTGSKFLLEIYNLQTVTTITPGHQFALVDMDSKTFTWVSGLPSKGDITSGAETGGVPMYHNGKIYLPITVLGSDAAIYTIDPTTAKATKGITLKGVNEVRTIGYLQAK